MATRAINQRSWHALTALLSISLFTAIAAPTANAFAPEIIVDAATGVAVRQPDLDKALAEVCAQASIRNRPRRCGIASAFDEDACKLKPQFTQSPWSVTRL